jgi:enamine deaminase RidA (YjgF/YER057c/UK114 family)
MQDIESRLAQLGVKLPKPAASVASYVPVRTVDRLLYISGQLSVGPEGIIKGTLGDTMDVAEGQQAATACALAILSQIRFTAGRQLDHIASIIKITVLVAAAPDFDEHHLVANGASDLFVHLLGENGQHARAAFGTSGLPMGAAVEIDAIVEMKH